MQTKKAVSSDTNFQSPGVIYEDIYYFDYDEDTSPVVPSFTIGVWKDHVVRVPKKYTTWLNSSLASMTDDFKKNGWQVSKIVDKAPYAKHSNLK